MPKSKRIAVVGLYRSGSSAIAGLLHRLGVNMGEPFFQDYYESAALSEQLRSWWNEPALEETATKSKRIRTLRKWMEDQEQTGSRWTGMKHPLLSLCGDDLLEAWGPDTRFIWCYRPLRESQRSLRELRWWKNSKFVQRKLWHELNRFFKAQPHLCVLFADTLARPCREIERLIKYLELAPEPQQIAAAKEFINQGRKARGAASQKILRPSTPSPAASSSLTSSSALWHEKDGV